MHFRFNQVYKFFSLKFTKNICDDIKWWRKDYKPDVLEEMYYYALKTYSNLIAPCPIKGNFSINKLPGEAFKYPPLLPAGEYRMDTRIYDGGKEVFFSLKTYALVKAKGLHDLKMK